MFYALLRQLNETLSTIFVPLKCQVAFSKLISFHSAEQISPVRAPVQRASINILLWCFENPETGNQVSTCFNSESESTRVRLLQVSLIRVCFKLDLASKAGLAKFSGK